MHVTVVSVLSHLAIKMWCFWKMKEKKYKRNINNDLAVVASHIPVGAVHDKRGEFVASRKNRGLPLSHR